jgi:hypothetical protein
VGGGKPIPVIIGGLLCHVDRIVKAAVRMGFRHSSSKKGRIPAWLNAVSDIRLVDISVDRASDATILSFEAPRFGDVTDEPYGQKLLFDPPPAQNDTAFNLFGDFIQDVSSHVSDSERYDLGLLKRFGQFGTDFKHGVDSIELDGDRLSIQRPPRIDSTLTAAAASLTHEIPAPKRARVAGKLNMIRVSDNVFDLLLDDGSRLRGVWTENDITPLANLLGKTVVVGGLAIFRASKSLLRLDANAIQLAGANDSFFSKMPQPAQASLDVKDIFRKQKARGGISALFGKWPGNETDEELLAALKEMG